MLHVQQYPQFFSGAQTYQSIAVGKTENSFEPSKYVYDINRYIVAKFVENGHYKVLNYTETLRSDADVLDSVKSDYQMDLVIFNTITDYLTEYDGYIKDTYADVFMTVIDVKAGKTVYTATHRGRCYDGDEFTGNVSSYQAQMCAIRDAIDKGIAEICPIEQVIEVQENMVQVYRQNGNASWDKATTFSKNDTMRITFALPEQAKYNAFKYDIACGNDDYISDTKSFDWEGRELSFDYSIADIMKTPECAKSLTIRLWNSGSLVLRKGIRVK